MIRLIYNRLFSILPPPIKKLIAARLVCKKALNFSIWGEGTVAENVDNAISKIKSKHIPDISQPAPISENDISDKGLYIAKDDYGDTYYYRGKVSNNNVYFAGYYWQIVRINGDSSIRLIYNGQEKNASGTSKFIKSSKFNNSIINYYS